MEPYGDLLPVPWAGWGAWDQSGESVLASGVSLHLPPCACCPSGPGQPESLTGDPHQQWKAVRSLVLGRAPCRWTQAGWGGSSRGWTCVAKVWHLFSVQTQRLSHAVLLPGMTVHGSGHQWDGESAGFRARSPSSLTFFIPSLPCRLVSLCCCGPSRPLTHGPASEFLGHTLGFVSFPGQRD